MLAPVTNTLMSRNVPPGRPSIAATLTAPSAISHRSTNGWSLVRHHGRQYDHVLGAGGSAGGSPHFSGTVSDETCTRGAY